MESQLHEVVKRLNDKGIDVWGWHVPHAAAVDTAQKEAQLVASLTERFNVSGVLIDPEAGEGFLEGDDRTADTY